MADLKTGEAIQLTAQVTMVSETAKLFRSFVFVHIDLHVFVSDHDRVKSLDGAEVSPSLLHTNLAHVRVHRSPVLGDAQPSLDAMMTGSLLLLSMI